MKKLALTIALLLAAAAPARAQLSPMNAAGITYGHVHLNVSDVDVHKKLWVDTFGGVFVQNGPLNVVKFPNLLIALTNRAPTGPSQGTAMDHFGFKVRSMPAMLTELRAAGYAVQSEFTGTEGFPNAYVIGPNGLRIELQEDGCAYQGPRHRLHRVRGEGPGGVLQEARGQRHQVRRAVPRGAGDWLEDRLLHRRGGGLHRADGRVRQLLRPRSHVLWP